MAGISFELRKMVQDKSMTSLGKAYGYATLLSSGPWVSSIVAILIIGFISFSHKNIGFSIVSYQLVITYAFAFASSIMLTGFIQLPFTRYIADMIYKRREDLVLPSYFGVLFVITLIGFIVLVPLSFYMFEGRSKLYIFLVVSIFIIMMWIWIANIIASSLKFYAEIFWAYFIAYFLMVILSYYFGDTIMKLLFIFLVSNIFLFVVLSIFIILSYPSNKLVYFGFFKMENFYWFLAFSGFFYSLAVWIDKFIFWYHPLTGSPTLGKLHSSVVYDIPIFLAYLTIVPGIAVFFFKLEAYFAQKYELFFNAVKHGGNLAIIDGYREDMIKIIRESIRELLFLQTVVTIMIYIYTPEIFELFHIPLLYSSLFHVDMVGAQLQLGFMSVLSILYYLDKRRATMWLSFLFLVLNAGLTLLSIELGPYFFGYGYAVSLLISFIVSLFVLNRCVEDIEYETFLLR